MRDELSHALFDITRRHCLVPLEHGAGQDAARTQLSAAMRAEDRLHMAKPVERRPGCRLGGKMTDSLWKGTIFGRPNAGAEAKRSRTTTMRDIEMFTAMTGDRNPVHYDAKLAEKAFGGLIVQGGVTTGLLNAVVAEDLPGPGAVFLETNWKFVKAVKVGRDDHRVGEGRRGAPRQADLQAGNLQCATRKANPASPAPRPHTRCRCAEVENVHYHRHHRA